MEKSAQQTRDQGTLVGENQPVDENGHHPMDSPLDLAPEKQSDPSIDNQHLTQGQSTYPGLRPEDANNTPGANPPTAGDVDKDATDSSTATGQDGDTTDKKKKKAYNYS